MATPVIMPRQGQSVESCIIGKWYKKVGDKVSVGEDLFTYETDKAAFDEAAKVDGEVLAAYDDRKWRCPPLDDVEPPTEDGQRIEFVADRDAWKRLVRLAAEWDLSYRRTVSRLIAGWLARAKASAR